jgi:hypothetical protein
LGLVTDVTDIEVDAAGDVRVLELLFGIRLVYRQIPGGVNDAQIWVSEVVSQPVGRHQRVHKDVLSL